MRSIAALAFFAAPGLAVSQPLPAQPDAIHSTAGGVLSAESSASAAATYPRWAAVIHGATIHFTPRPKNTKNLSWNNQNVGAALRYEWSPVWAGQVGTFRNSINIQSHYVLADWTPLAPFDGLRGGAFMGTVNGYGRHDYALTSSRNPKSFVPIGGLTARVDLPLLPAGSALAARFVPRIKQTQSAFISFELAVGF